MAIVSLPLPIQLLNGNVADAGEVMTDLNAIASNVNANAAKNGVNSDITQLTALIAITSFVTITSATIGNLVVNTVTVNGGTLNNVSITNSTIDGNTTVPTQPSGTSNNTIASTQFVQNVAFNSSLPSQAGNAGKFVTTDGSTASWSFVPLGTSTTGQLPISQGGTGGISGIPGFLLFAQGVI